MAHHLCICLCAHTCMYICRVYVYILFADLEALCKLEVLPLYFHMLIHQRYLHSQR